MGQGLEPEGTGTGPGKPGPGSTREPEGTGTFKNRPVTSLPYRNPFGRGPFVLLPETIDYKAPTG